MCFLSTAIIFSLQVRRTAPEQLAVRGFKGVSPFGTSIIDRLKACVYIGVVPVVYSIVAQLLAWGMLWGIEWGIHFLTGV